MIVGNPSIFAIESGIAKAYERLCFRALGFFVIHVGGRCYGVREPDAAMLACAFDEVGRTIDVRGRRTAPFSTEPNAGQIAHAYRNAFFADVQEQAHFGIPLLEFRELVPWRHIDAWQPNVLDEAFDDGSYVLQFDVRDRVRLIAFKSQGFDYDPETLTDVWIEADAFYSILQQWRGAFVAEWLVTPKIPEAEDGAEDFGSTP